LSDDGLLEQEAVHPLWVVASQDCDLAAVDETSNTPCLEIRPLYSELPPQEWGIRAHKLRLTDSHYVDASMPRVMISAAALHSSGALDPVLQAPPARALALKTWLGKRYDRPAVPASLVPLADAIARAAKNKTGLEVAGQIHDVLMQFDETTEPPGYILFAVVEDAADFEAVRSWLGTIALTVSSDEGQMVGYDVGTKDKVSLRLLEESYSASTSSITWGTQEPTGAT
jgi:hypothetical protein